LGVVANEQKDNEAAKEYYQKALVIYMQYQDVYSQGRVYQNLGVVAQEQKDYQGAEEYYQKALTIYVQYQDAHRQGRVYQNLGITAKEQKDYQAAKESYQKALERYLQSPEAAYSIANTIHSMLTFAKQSGEIAFGKAMYEKALPFIAEEYKADLQALYDDLDQP
jgi:tetratricopeptide (TPR) repeat protein